jgi:hypothetical protein
MAALRKITMLCLLVAAVLFAGMPGAASAAHKHVGSAASIGALSADGVAGHVSSSQAACRAKRAVTVYMVNSSRPSTAVPFGRAITSGDGSWSVQDWAYPGEYYAVVGARKTRHLVCGTATSSPQTWWTSGAGS